jgi:hypothetical protein
MDVDVGCKLVFCSLFAALFSVRAIDVDSVIERHPTKGVYSMRNDGTLQKVEE